MNYRLLLLLSLSLVLITLSCNKDQAEEDEKLILEYLSDNNLTAERTSSGLHYIIEKEGTGDFPELSDVVTVHYEGFLLDGTKFDSSIDRGDPSTFPLSGVIDGWQEGIPKFKKGGKGVLLIPSSLGYGSNPPLGSKIGKNDVLLFNIELLDF